MSKRGRESSPELFEDDQPEESGGKKRKVKRAAKSNQSKKHQTTSSAPNASTSAQNKSHLLSLPDKVIYDTFAFLNMDEIFRSLSLVCKQLNELTYKSIEKISLSGESTQFSDISHVTRVIGRMNRINELCFDGFDLLTDAALHEFLQRCPSSLKALHIRQCNLERPLISSMTLQTLKLSLSGKMEKLDIKCPELITLELYDCELADAPKFDTPKLETLKFMSCTNFTDKRLVQILKQFDEHEVILSSTGHSQETQETRKRDHKVNSCLKHLWITECEPISNPLFQCDSLEDLHIVNCQRLSNPFIRCLGLKHLQLNWCENLENLILGCDSLKSIDLSGSGVNTYRSSQGEFMVRDNIVTSLRRHFNEQISISY